MEPLIVTVAAVGAELTLEQTPHLPYTPALLGETAARCREAGAAIVHVHCRDDAGANTSEVGRFAGAMAAIRAKSDLIVQFTTGSAVGMSVEERLAPLRLRPEMATLTCGTVNFGDEVFENDFPLMRAVAARCREFGVAPELEIFDAGHLENARRLEAEGHIRFPAHFDFVLGVPGGLGASLRNLAFLSESLPAGSTWSVAGIGRAQLAMATLAIAAGGHVRVGLEDNIYLSRGRLATNEELVARVARIAREFGRPLATPDEARERLGLAASASAGKPGNVSAPR